VIVVALVVLLAGLATAPLARSGSAARPPLVAHVPGQPIWVRPQPPFGFEVWLVAATISVVLTVGAIVLAPAFEVAAAFFSVGVLGLITAIFRRYASGCQEVRDAVTAYAPRIAFACAGDTDHLATWARWIAPTGIPWVVVARTPELFAELATAYSGFPLVQGEVPASVTGVLHRDDAPTNAAFAAGPGATHVVVGRTDERRFTDLVTELANQPR
jgi:hypothetical protein